MYYSVISAVSLWAQVWTRAGVCTCLINIDFPSQWPKGQVNKSIAGHRLHSPGVQYVGHGPWCWTSLSLAGDRVTVPWMRELYLGRFFLETEAVLWASQWKCPCGCALGAGDWEVGGDPECVSLTPPNVIFNSPHPPPSPDRGTVCSNSPPCPQTRRNFSNLSVPVNKGPDSSTASCRNSLFQSSSVQNGHVNLTC